MDEVPDQSVASMAQSGAPTLPAPMPSGENPREMDRLRRLMARGKDFANRPAWRAAAFNLGFYGASYSLRFAGNIVLTRLLFPEQFGLMALANALRQGVEMLSDIGIGPSIVQNKRGDDPNFVNTAWTLQIVRACLMWLVALAIAWPAQHFIYPNDPELLFLFPAVALCGLIGGFNSTALYTLNRHLRMGRITALNLTSQVSGLVTMVLLAWYCQGQRSLAPYAVWSLVIGALLSQCVQTFGSHLLDPRVRNRLCWDRTAVHAVFHFAKWIFISTLLTYFMLQLDQLMLGRLLSKDDLGVFSVAKNMAVMIPSAVSTLGAAVMFPVLARVVRDEPQRIRAKVERVRTLVLLPSALALALLVVFGNDIIHALYKPDYHGAGWMLRILAAGAIGVLISPSYGQAMMALGRGEQIVWLLVSLIGFMLAGTLIGYYFFGGLQGFVIGLALTEWLNYPFVALRARKYGVWTPRVDAMLFVVAAIAVALAFVRG
jgi:O-antigen/teichoic acid export membrane protein